MIICFLFTLSFSIISPVKLNVGKNTITVSASQQIEIKEVQSQSYFLFPQPISKNVEITVESNGRTLGQINNENIGVYFGINSGQITFRLTAASASQDTIDFYYLSPSHHSSKSYLSTYPNDAFVISRNTLFASVKKYRPKNTIAFWHVTGHPQQLVTSSVQGDPLNTVLFAYDKISENVIEAKSTDPVTISSNGLIYFLWNAEVQNKKGTYKIIIHPEKSHFENKPPVIPKIRYEFPKLSETCFLKINHNYGDYEKLEKLGEPLPMDQLNTDDGNTYNKNNIIQFSFEPSVLTLLFSLIGIIVILLCILIYVGLMPVPSSSSILNQKVPNDEESLLKDSEKSPELAAFLKSNQ